MLQLYKNKIILDKTNLPELDSVKEMIDVLKDDAVKPILYMYLMYNRSEENPLKEFNMSNRNSKAKMIAFGDDNAEIAKLYPDSSKLILKAFKDYEELFVDDLQKQIDLSDTKMYEFMDLLEQPKNKKQIIRNVHEVSG